VQINQDAPLLQTVRLVRLAVQIHVVVMVFVFQIVIEILHHLQDSESLSFVLFVKPKH